MPYITPNARVDLWNGDPAINPGQLNFQIAEMCNAYIDREGRSYETFNAVIGVLECQKLELYRRLVAPYEDKKLEANTDVYSTP